MNWFTEQRQAWIAETLRVFGYINREHIMRKFGVSCPQASADIRQFKEANPGAIRYDGSAKCYVYEGGS